MEEPLLLLCLCCRYYEPASFSPCSTSVREEIRSCNEKWTKPNSWGRECYFLSPKCNPFPLYFSTSKKGLEYMYTSTFAFLPCVSVYSNELLDDQDQWRTDYGSSAPLSSSISNSTLPSSSEKKAMAWGSFKFYSSSAPPILTWAWLYFPIKCGINGCGKLTSHRIKNQTKEIATL